MDGNPRRYLSVRAHLQVCVRTVPFLSLSRVACSSTCMAPLRFAARYPHPPPRPEKPIIPTRKRRGCIMAPRFAVPHVSARRSSLTGGGGAPLVKRSRGLVSPQSPRQSSAFSSLLVRHHPRACTLRAAAENTPRELRPRVQHAPLWSGSRSRRSGWGEMERRFAGRARVDVDRPHTPEPTCVAPDPAEAIAAAVANKGSRSPP